MVPWKITEADTLTIQLGATLSRLISNPPPPSPIFTLHTLTAAALAIHPGLVQAPNMLACILSGLVKTQHTDTANYRLNIFVNIVA